MGSLRVRDIMTSCVQGLAAETPLQEAARMLTENQVGGAPVLDQGRIVGVVSKSDLVAVHQRTDDRATVADVMTHVIYAVRPTDPVMSAIRLMVQENVHRAIVVDGDGRLAGVITPMDVLRALSRGDRVREDDGAGDALRERHAEAAIAVQYVDLRTIEIRG
jgi:predicted transcriptional regulator